MTTRTDGWDAVVLAGGESRRMGGGDKVALDVGGRSMLERVIAAVAGAGRTVVVGPRRTTSTAVVWCVEDPPLTGPAAAVGAGLAHVTAPLVVLLAADQPLVDAHTVQALLGALADDPACADGAVAVDGQDQPQWLCSAWQAAALRDADLRADMSLRRALAPLRWGRVPVAATAAMDCDTPDDLRRVRELAR